MKLKKFQLDFIRAVEDDRYDTCVMSGPRTLGKTFLAGKLLERCMTPGDSLFQEGKEVVLGASTLEQARLAYMFVREALEPTGEYRFSDSTTRSGILHLPTHTRLRVISSSAKGSFGLVGVPLVVLDEPAALDLIGGQLLADSLFTAQGKVGSRLKLIITGTLAPGAAEAGHWFHDLVMAGTRRSVYVSLFQGDADTWDSWATIRKANPLIMEDAHTRKVILEERDEARGDSRLKARFLSYRLNLPSKDEAECLLTTSDWEAVVARPVPARKGKAIVSVDMGAGRSWSAATAIYKSGRVEALAVAPGIPDIAAQEKRDRVSSGTYAALVNSGKLELAQGLRVPTAGQLWSAITSSWGLPAVVITDRFRIAEWLDAVGGKVRVIPRVTRWSEASEDIRALRKIAKDGPMSVEPSSRLLVAASLAAATVKNDDQGSFRLTKRANNVARDDVAAALTLLAGGYLRAELSAPPSLKYHGAA